MLYYFFLGLIASDVFNLRRFIAWDVCCLGCFGVRPLVGRTFFSFRGFIVCNFVIWDILLLRTFFACSVLLWGRFVFGIFCLRTFCNLDVQLLAWDGLRWDVTCRCIYTPHSIYLHNTHLRHDMSTKKLFRQEL